MPKGFKKGVVSNPNGKKPGTKNRTTKEAKELLEQILLGEVDNIKSALIFVKKKDPARYLDSCAKLFTYVLPKKTDITSDGNSIEPISITFVRHGNPGK
jgi:hypothetical protein